MKLNIELLNGVALARGERPDQRVIWVWDEEKTRFYMATNGHRLFLAREQKDNGEPAIHGFFALDYEGRIKYARNWTHALFEPIEGGRAILKTSKDEKIVSLPQYERPKGWDDLCWGADWEEATAFRLFSPENMSALRGFLGDGIYFTPETRSNETLAPCRWCWEGKRAVVMPLKIR